MKEFIIDYPHLQSLQKRVGSLLVWMLCWLMWLYLLIPLVTLADWLLGDYKMNDEMRWFGGYSSLLHLLKIYAEVLLVQVVLWLSWVYFRVSRKTKRPALLKEAVDDEQLCAFYHVSRGELAPCRWASLITVFFDEQGKIIHLEPKINEQES